MKVNIDVLRVYVKKMKTKIMDLNKTEKGSKELPVQFNEPVRFDLIQRSVLALQAGQRQAYGVYEEAGKQHTVWLSKRRRDYKAMYGHGISRTPRKIHSRNGTQFNWVGAEVPGTVGGRVAHPPKSSKIWDQKINEKENRKAICSAISATMNSELIKARGHLVPNDFPFIIDNKVELLSKTSDVQKALDKLGFEKEIERSSKKKLRAGKGKARGRKHETRIGPLFVVSSNCNLSKSARNIPGVDVVEVKHLNTELLAPGTHPGRLTLWSEAAIDELNKQKLFTENYKGESQVKAKKEVVKETVVAKKTSKAKPVKIAAKKSAKKSE